jgi:hypothetical protein
LDLPLRPALFPSQAPPSQSTPRHPHGPKTSWVTAALGRSPTLRVSVPPREIPDPPFLDCGGLTPLWIFPSARSTSSPAPSSRSTPGHPHGHKTPWATAALHPQPSASSRLRVRSQPNHPPSSREIPDPSFLDCGGLTPLWIFPFDPLYSHPKLRQAGALQDTLTAPKHLG